MRESDVENYLIEKVKLQGGEIRKVKWIGRRGAPDRVVFLGGAHFVECKAPGEKPEPHQRREHRRMLNHDVMTWVLDSYKAIDRFIEAVGKNG